MLLYSMMSCISEKREASGLAHIDVSASFPEKVIGLEDIADIEYLQLEVNERFLFSISSEHNYCR